MLSRLLKVENSLNVFVFELLDYTVLLNKTVAQPLRSNQEVFNPFRMQPLYRRVVAFLPIFMFAPFPHTRHRTMQLCLPFKIPCFKLHLRLRRLPLFQQNKRCYKKYFNLSTYQLVHILVLVNVRRLHTPHLFDTRLRFVPDFR